MFNKTYARLKFQLMLLMRMIKIVHFTLFKILQTNTVHILWCISFMKLILIDKINFNIFMRSKNLYCNKEENNIKINNLLTEK